MSPKKIFIVPMAHYDLAWLGTQEECLSRGNKLITLAVSIAHKDKDFHYLVEDMVFIDTYLKDHPEKLEELKNLAAEERFEYGPKWAGIYINFQDEESLARNTMYAKHFIKNVLGGKSETVQPTDIPSGSPQYPQILSKTGVKYCVLTRCAPRDRPLFYWRAPDGSKVLTYSSNHYASACEFGCDVSVEYMRSKNFEAEAKAELARSGGPALISWGADLFLPPERICQVTREWNEQSEIKIEIATPTKFFKAAEKTENIPEISGEIPCAWYKIEPTFAHIMPLDTMATNLLLTAEKLATACYLLGYLEYPTDNLELAWKALLMSMDHNWDGNAAEEGDRRHMEWKQLALLLAREILNVSVRSISEKVEAPEMSIPLVVFNPLSWERTDVVTAHVSFIWRGILPDWWKWDVIGQEDEILIEDSAGKVVPYQITEDRRYTTRDIKLVFVAEKIPPLGYKTYYLKPTKKITPGQRTAKVARYPSGILLENDFFLISIDQTNGYINIFDKELRRKIVEDLTLIGLEETKKSTFFSEETTGEIFENSIKKVEIVENGPVRTRILVRGRVFESSTEQDIRLYNSLRRIDLATTVHWNEDGKRMIKQVFPIKIEKPKVVYGIPYGANDFNNVMPGSGPRRLDDCPPELWKVHRVVQKWLDISNSDYGVTISSDRRVFKIEDSTIEAYIVIGGYAPKQSYTVNFSILSHGQDWKAVKSYRRGWEATNNAICYTVNDTITKKTLPPKMSFCDISADNVIVTAFKKAEEGENVVLRFYETEGTQTEANVRLFKEVKAAFETNLLEESSKKIDGQTVQVSPWEIKTVKLEI